MRGNNQETLQGVALTQGRTQVTSGVFKGANTFHCHADGTVTFIWKDGSTQADVPFFSGEAFPFDAASIEVKTGTFSIGYD